MELRKIPKHIEIVRSTTVALSSMSQKSCDAIYNLLKHHFTEVGVTTVNNAVDLEVLVSKQPDLVFMGMKYVPGKLPNSKIWISDYLKQHQINHTGSSKKAIELEQNKPLAKQRILDAGLKSAPFYVIEHGCKAKKEDTPLTFPLFIKPTNRGGGLGIDSDSVVHNFGELSSKVQSLAASLQADSLIEEYLPGREFSVAILKDEFSPEFLVMPIEKIAPPDQNGERLLSGQVKSADVARDLKIADKATKARITSLAINAFHALGARDYGRIDIRLDKFDTPYFLEANLLPSLIRGYGSFPKACVLNVGLDYEAMILRIVRLGLAHPTIFTEETQEANSAMYSPAVAPAAI